MCLTSADHEVGCGKAWVCRGTNQCDLDSRRRRTITVCVVIERAGGGVVDDSIIGIMSSRGTGSRIESRIGTDKVACRGSQGCKYSILKDDFVAAAGEGKNRILIAGNRRIEQIQVITCAAIQSIVAQPSVDSVVTSTTVDQLATHIATQLVAVTFRTLDPFDIA